MTGPDKCFTGTTTAAELQSGMDRQKWAENLILQLPANHDGRNSWLMNYGRGAVAQAIRKERGLLFNEQSQAVNPPAQSASVAQAGNDSGVIAAIDPFTRGAFTGWVGKTGNSKITLDEAEEHFSLCMADMMDAARAAAKGSVDVAYTAPEPDTVTIPATALEWLFGAMPDHEGLWFGESIEQKKPYGWRSRFRTICAALGYPIPSTDRGSDNG